MQEVFAPSFFFVWNQIPKEKSTGHSIASRFFCMYSFNKSMDSQNLIIGGSISSKTISIFPKNLLNLRWDTTETQINVSSYGNKSYTSLVRNDSEVAFGHILTDDHQKLQLLHFDTKNDDHQKLQLSHFDRYHQKLQLLHSD